LVLGAVMRNPGCYGFTRKLTLLLSAPLGVATWPGPVAARPRHGPSRWSDPAARMLIWSALMR